MSNVLARIDKLKRELDALRPLPPDVVARVGQKLRIESNYHSNAVEGNSLTLGETRSLILHGLTAHGKPMRDHLDIKGHDDAVKAVEDAVTGERKLTEAFIRTLHAILLKEPYEVDAETPDGRPARRRVEIGTYKSAPNNVRTSTGEIYYFTPPEQVKPAMSDLIDWYAAREAEREHPIVLAATFHYRFVRVHPFDDGNGRMARLLMNMILIRHGYTVALVRQEQRDRYIGVLERADKTEDPSQFVDYIASCCEYALDLHLKAARGEPIEDPDDIDREIALFKGSFAQSEAVGDQIEAATLVERTLFPFREYCREKVRMLSDEFASVYNNDLSIRVRRPDGELVILPHHQSEELSTIPKIALNITASFIYDFYGFRSTKTIKQVFVDSELSASGCKWTFGSTFTCSESYNGRDLNELKRRFNGLLRAMMNDLGRQVPPP